jgi:hypothetical protein
MKGYNMAVESFSRRELLNRGADAIVTNTPIYSVLGLTGAALYFILGCATNPYKQKPEDFSIGNFNRWFKRNELYSKANPNLKSPHTTMHTFKQAFPKRWTPGISYTVPRGETIVASAPGEVMESKILRTGRAGGWNVELVHCLGLITYYAHMDVKYVNYGDKLKRGDPIGIMGDWHKNAKIMLTIGGNWSDPDHYGLNHSYMTYQKNLQNKFVEFSEEEMRNRKNRQYEIWRTMQQHLDSESIGEKKWPTMWHNKNGYKPSNWSVFERFKRLSILYDVKADLFPGINTKKYNQMKKEFYDNQPIILTLPLRKKNI